jgi:hypothetical protein
MTDIRIQVIGIEKIQAALTKFPREISKYLTQAGDEAAKSQVLNTTGLKNYPPATAANAPPTPYYIRGRGTQTSQYHNTGTSERYGSQWYVQREGMGTIIGNRSSYGIFVGGDRQPPHMAAKGWKKLVDVATEKLPQITKIYQTWINKLLKDLNL